MRKWTLYDAHLENGRGMICASDDGYYIAYDKFYDEISFGKNNYPLIYFQGIKLYKHEDTSYMLYKWEKFITYIERDCSIWLERK